MLTIPEARVLLRRLDGEPADAIESETLEAKPWNADPRAKESRLRDLRETVVCLANQRGGVILLGIADRKRTRAEAIHGVGDLDANEVRRRIYDGTAPPVLVDVDELIEPEGRILLVRVPRGLPPHTTSEGVGKIRVGKECKPLTGPDLARLLLAEGSRDLTAETAAGAILQDLDQGEIQRLRRTIEVEGRKPDLAALPARELLENLGLVRGDEVTLAAVLLLGRASALARFAPHHEVVFLKYRTQTQFDARHDMKGPLLAVLERLKELLEAHVRIEPIQTLGFGEIEVPDVTWSAAREAVLNALVHRDWFVRKGVHVEVRKGRFVVANPGGFVGGVAPTNVLRHPPARRNPLLAGVFQTIGLVNRAGVGVDRIYEEMLRIGKGLPRYEADEAHVRLTLPTPTHAEFVRFVAEESRAGRKIELDDLILLRAVADRGHLDRWTAREVGQFDTEEDAAERLVSLRERGYLLPQGRGRGTAYRLARRLAERLRGRVEADQEVPLDEEALRLRVEAVLIGRGKLTNAEVRRISGYSRTQALRLVQALREDGVLEIRGKGRGAHYAPGPKARKPAKGRGKRS